ncbi:selenide, water dikinase SelD [Planomonospora parontospora]|uniref:selenide, water dikinase SelD n=1 Tax=Planomonospora parontospora TaxID=58119 RepID=UPI0016711357|nr:selenide, water dikinase SelD [Planomonospora parontospora]GGL40671.1 selenide, water dikinase [Planomonospora parontospora subsp. antibiotica]GII18235.1 selenide, water dikinase [Planomonospora parontospora subsp. antibiotica]
MTETTRHAVRLTSLSPGAGCACKLPQSSLEQLMNGFGPMTPASGTDLLVGLPEGDDAAVLRLNDTQALILTTDFFTPIVDDPYDWGRIAAANALSDVYAMGGRPILALNLAAWPGDGLPIEMLTQVMKGAAAVAGSAGCAVVGGHTIADPVPKYGMAVLGMADPTRLLTIDQANVGDQLILTKPIGTGVVVTALKHDAADPAAVAEAVKSMTSLNAAASDVAVEAGARAATDVTGFGLLGHLRRMLTASGVAAEVDADRVPFLPDARELAGKGFVSGGTRANMDFLTRWVRIDPSLDDEVSVLLHDAQTSGGLLIAAPAPADDLMERLYRRGVPAVTVGRIVDGPAGRITVRADAES